MEEQRIIVLNNLEELEQKIKDLNDQMDESSREVYGFSWLFFFNLASENKDTYIFEMLVQIMIAFNAHENF